MTMFAATSVAVLGCVIGLVHSVIGERRILGPLYAENQQGILKPRATQAIIRAVWHLPSIAWALLGVAVYLARLTGGVPIVSLTAAAMFAISGASNLIALRRPFIGGLLLLATSALTILDWQIHAAVH